MTGSRRRVARASIRTSATGPSTSRGRPSPSGWATPGRSTTRSRINGGVRWDADFGALDPPHITTAGHVRPAARRTSRDTALAAWRHSSIPAACATSTTSRRAAASPGTSAARAAWSCAAAAASTSAFPTRTPPSATSRSTASASWSTRSRTTASPGSSRIRRAAITADDIFAGRVPLPAQSPRVIASDYKMPYTWQSSIGFQTAGRRAAGASRPTSRTGRATTSPVSATRIWPSTRPPATTSPPTAATRPDPKFGTDSVARVHRQGRLRRHLSGHQQALCQQLAGVVDLHLHAVS